MKIKKSPNKAIAASSVVTTARFYQDVLGMDSKKITETTLEVEETIQYKEKPAWVTYIEEVKRRVSEGNRTTEILLESDSLEEFLNKCQNNSDVRVISPVKQVRNSVKLYDPDNHIIEIAEKLFNN